jgi:hypothetical protein
MTASVQMQVGYRFLSQRGPIRIELTGLGTGSTPILDRDDWQALRAMGTAAHQWMATLVPPYPTGYPDVKRRTPGAGRDGHPRLSARTRRQPTRQVRSAVR